MVRSEVVAAEELEAKVQSAKDEGRRILAVSPSTLTRRSRVSKEYDATSYVLVTQ